MEPFAKEQVEDQASLPEPLSQDQVHQSELLEQSQEELVQPLGKEHMEDQVVFPKPLSLHQVHQSVPLEQDQLEQSEPIEKDLEGCLEQSMQVFSPASRFSRAWKPNQHGAGGNIKGWCGRRILPLSWRSLSPAEFEKYYKAVEENPEDFTAWTYLLQYVGARGEAA